PSVYFRHVLATVVDLHFAGIEPWSDVTTMNQIGRTLSTFILDGEADGFGRDVGGGIARAGLEPSGEDNWARISPALYNVSPFVLFTAWDDSGEVAKTSVGVHIGRGQSEWNVYVPTGLLLAAALNSGAAVHGGDQ